MRDPIYVKLRDLVYQACGIYHSEEKLYLLAGACKRRFGESSKAKGPASIPGPDQQPIHSRARYSANFSTRSLLGKPACSAASRSSLPCKTSFCRKLIATRGKIGLRRLRDLERRLLHRRRTPHALHVLAGAEPKSF